MKVIFLDIDGVLNCQGTFLSADAQEQKMHLSRERIGILNRLLTMTDAQIVISSSWRILHTVHEIQLMLMCFGLERKFHDVIIDKTPRLNSGFRGREIEAWLKDHPEVENYVILDDDSDMLPEQHPHFVNTRFYTGLTFLDCELAEAILKDDQEQIESIKESYRTFMWKDIFDPDKMKKEVKRT